MCTRMMPSVRCSAAGQLDRAVGRERLLVLRDLIALGQIRIEIVLPREDRMGVNPAAEGERGPNRQLHGPAVQDRQCARQPEADGTQLRVGLGAEAGAAAAENLGGRQELRVDLQADDRLKRGHGWGDCATETAADHAERHGRCGRSGPRITRNSGRGGRTHQAAACGVRGYDCATRVNASTTSGSNCSPAQRRISRIASS